MQKLLRSMHVKQSVITAEVKMEEYNKIKQLYVLHQEELREMRSRGRDNSREHEQLDGGQSDDQLNWDNPDAPPSNSPQ
jgi:hypothetical protein